MKTQVITNRERHKSAPYLRLKIAKGLQNVKVLVNWGPFHENKIGKKVTQCQKNERGTLWDFSTSILSERIKKLKEPFGENVFYQNKVSQGRKYSKRVPVGPVEFLR